MSKKPEIPVQSIWSPLEDVRLLELHRDGKSWDYIEGKLDDRGKNMTALKARLAELTQVSEGTSNPNNVQSASSAKDHNSATSSGKKDKTQTYKEKKQGSGSESKKGSSKSGILKDSSPAASNKKGPDRNILKKDTGKVATGAKEGYIGKGGRGEVRFYNGVPILYKHSGADAEELDAQTVSI